MINQINYSDAQSRRREKADNKKTSFKGIEMPVLSGLNWMKNNPALSACGVDVCSMALPRTAVEVRNRGRQAGIETFIREMSSAVINASIGMIGFLSAALYPESLCFQ